MSQPPAGGPPPWVRPQMQHLIEWRDDDIVISVPIKSGTTWTMNIVYQLLHGGDPDFADIYAEVPWIELVERPGQPTQEMLDRIAAMPLSLPRPFKTHSAPPDVPYLEASEDKTVRYVVVCRNPEEALVSARPFLEDHTEAWFELWGVPKAALTRDDFPTFYREVVDPNQFQAGLFGFIAAWWPLRKQPNVLFMHFADMKRDHAGSLRRFADFLGIRPSEDQWRRIEEYTSFRWMKEHQSKFEARTITDVPILESGGMIRKGRLGDAAGDGMTPEIAEHLRARGRELCPDAEALEWLYSGGPVSSLRG
jgi:aryl sulfotransferase